MENKQFQEIDQNILKNSPFQWIIGWHIFIPIIAIASILAILVGFIPPVKTYSYSVEYLGLFAAFISLLSIIIFVFFIIRQIKFNSFRIHHKLPYRNSILNFFSFWLIAILLISVPFLTYEAYTFKVKTHLSSLTDNFSRDIVSINEGLPFFYVESNYNAVNSMSFKNNDINVTSRNSFTYNTGNLKVDFTEEEAYIAIEEFIRLANVYEIKLTDYEPFSIFESRKEYVETKGSKSFSLLSFEDYENEYRVFNTYSNILRNYDNNQKFAFENKQTYFLIITFSLSIALLLWIFISVKKREFGLAILYGALISLFVGILTAVIGQFVVYLSFLAIAIYAFAFKKSQQTKIFKILSQVIIPFITFIICDNIFKFIGYSYEFDDYILFFSVISIIISVVIYTKIYRDDIILPQ